MDGCSENDGSQNYFLIEGDVYEVEKLVGTKVVDGKKLYKVRWKGYSAQADTYEPEENLLSCKDMIAELEERLQRKRQKRLKVCNNTFKIREPEASTSTQCSQEAELGSRDQSKDTFWKDFNEGKIDMVYQKMDMYSKVKGRAARAVSQNDGKQSEARAKESHTPACPTVILKRNDSSVVPTYKSTLKVKSTSCVKAYKRHDVAKHYKRRKKPLRKFNLDENKHFKKSLMDTSHNTSEASDAMYQVKSRSLICHSKSPVKTEHQHMENAHVTEYSKVLQELPANDEVVCSDALSNYAHAKILMDSAKINQGARGDEMNLNAKEIKTDPRKTGDSKDFAKASEVGQPGGSLSDASAHAMDDLTMENRLASRSEAFCNLERIPVQSSKLNVVTARLIERWRSLKLNYLLHKFLNPETVEHSSNWFTFDLLMGTSLQGRIDLLEKMCLRGAFLNHVLHDGTTAIMIASQLGLYDAVHTLLTYMAHKDLQNRFGETALMLACHHKRPRIVKLLLDHGANFALASFDGATASRLSKSHVEDIRIPNILNEHISKMKLEFENKARHAAYHLADIKYALFPIQCLSLSEGPLFSIRFSYGTEPHEKGGKDFLLFIASCNINTNNPASSSIKCDFEGDSLVLYVILNGVKLEPLRRGNNSLVRIPWLRTGINEIRITAVHRPHSMAKLVVCGYVVEYQASHHVHPHVRNVFMN